jgi:hypothetical protein
MLPYEASVNVAADTVSVSCVLAVAVPAVPVTVSVYCPGAAVALALSVSVVPYVVGLGENDAVTPLGRPETDNATFAVTPFVELR